MEGYARATQDTSVMTYICAPCAQRITFVEEESECTPLQNLYELLANYDDAAAVRDVFGIHEYLERYTGGMPLPARQRLRAELEDQWQLNVHMYDTLIRVMMCREDRSCSTGCLRCATCSNCTVPVCRQCLESIVKKKSPPEALARDLFFGSIPGAK